MVYASTWLDATALYRLVERSKSMFRSAASARRPSGKHVAGLCAALFLSLTVPAMAQQYTITDLGAPFQGSKIVPTGINNNGVVVGWVGTEPNTVPFRWDSVNGLVSLGYVHSGDTYAAANGINDTGNISGFSGPPGSISGFIGSGFALTPSNDQGIPAHYKSSY